MIFNDSSVDGDFHQSEPITLEFLSKSMMELTSSQEDFRRETRDDFSDSQRDMAEVRSDIAEMRGYIAEMKKQMREIRMMLTTATDEYPIQSDSLQSQKLIDDWDEMKEILLPKVGYFDDPDKIKLVSEDRRSLQESVSRKIHDHERETIESTISMQDVDSKLMLLDSILEVESHYEPSPDSESITMQAVSIGTELIQANESKTENFPQHQVHLSLLESGHRDSLLGNVEMNVLVEEFHATLGISFDTSKAVKDKINLNVVAYQVYDRMLLRKHRLQQKKMTLSPKSCHFKFRSKRRLLARNGTSRSPSAVFLGMFDLSIAQEPQFNIMSTLPNVAVLQARNIDITSREVRHESACICDEESMSQGQSHSNCGSDVSIVQWGAQVNVLQVGEVDEFTPTSNVVDKINGQALDSLSFKTTRMVTTTKQRKCLKARHVKFKKKSKIQEYSREDIKINLAKEQFNEKDVACIDRTLVFPFNIEDEGEIGKLHHAVALPKDGISTETRVASSAGVQMNATKSEEFDVMVETLRAPGYEHSGEKTETRTGGFPLLGPYMADYHTRCLQIIVNANLKLLGELSSGIFGTVYHGKWRELTVAIKRVDQSCFVHQGFIDINESFGMDRSLQLAAYTDSFDIQRSWFCSQLGDPMLRKRTILWSHIKGQGIQLQVQHNKWLEIFCKSRLTSDSDSIWHRWRIKDCIYDAYGGVAQWSILPSSSSSLNSWICLDVFFTVASCFGADDPGTIFVVAVRLAATIKGKHLLLVDENKCTSASAFCLGT